MSVESFYDILGVTESSSQDEIKKAYKKMAVKYHPDKVMHLGEEFQKSAKDKFLKVLNTSYLLIRLPRILPSCTKC